MDAQVKQARPRILSGAAVAVAAFIAVMFMGSTLLTPLYVLYQQAFGFSRITLTLIYAAYVIGNCSALFFFGRLSDELGRRRVALPAMALAAISMLLFFCATNTLWLSGARILSGFAIGLASGTGTAWMAELLDGKDKGRAAVIAASANFVGIGIGPLLAGVLAQYAPRPLQLPFVIYLLLLGGVALFIWRTPETISHRSKPREFSLQPRVGVPAGLRAQFIAPAVTAFGIFSLIGFYAALTPSVLSESLQQTNHAVGGAVVCLLFVVATAITVASASVASRAAMLWGLSLLLPAVVLLVVAQALKSMGMLLAGVVMAGLAGALGYRGSLQVINQIAPQQQRAELVSSYLLAGFIGNSLPIIGVGVLANWRGPIVASSVFAATIGVFAAVALFVETLVHRRLSAGSRGNEFGRCASTK